MLATASAEETPAGLRRLLGDFVKPIPSGPKALTPAAELGRMLFFDKRLSPAGVSCNDCHSLKDHGANGEHAMTLRKEGKLFRDVPSVYNLGHLTMFGWDGSTKTLSERVAKSLLSEHESAAQGKEQVSQALVGIKGYQPLFAAAFPKSDQPVNCDNAVAALSAFLEGLRTPAPFDRFLEGDDKALTADQVTGGYLFDKNNCAACHTGSLLGGQMLQKLGTIRPWPNQEDQGYYHVTKSAAHKMVFRVAPLRNLAKTAPYFHDGSSRRVWQAVKRMGEYEAGRHMNVEEVLAIQTFLESLTGEIPEAYAKTPVLPE
jgi:cytochrome c peroxidase